MKRRITSIAILTCLLMIAQMAQAQGGRTDLTMRRALYFTGAKTDNIDLKHDRYVVENGMITLKQSDATKCEDSGCHFNIGFIALRQPAAGGLSTYGLIQAPGGLFGNTILFADKETTKQGVFDVKLVVGSNKVTFQIDPYKKTPEWNESNNSVSVTVVVEGKP